MSTFSLCARLSFQGYLRPEPPERLQALRAPLVPIIVYCTSESSIVRLIIGGNLDNTHAPPDGTALLALQSDNAMILLYTFVYG